MEFEVTEKYEPSKFESRVRVEYDRWQYRIGGEKSFADARDIRVDYQNVKIEYAAFSDSVVVKLLEDHQYRKEFLAMYKSRK